MLRYDQHIPANVADGAPLFVLLHGRGSHKGDLMGLQPHLPPEAIVVAPEAPFPGAAWAMARAGPGTASRGVTAPSRRALRRASSNSTPSWRNCPASSLSTPVRSFWAAFPRAAP